MATKPSSSRKMANAKATIARTMRGNRRRNTRGKQLSTPAASQTVRTWPTGDPRALSAFFSGPLASHSAAMTVEVSRNASAASAITGCRPSGTLTGGCRSAAGAANGSAGTTPGTDMGPGAGTRASSVGAECVDCCSPARSVESSEDNECAAESAARSVPTIEDSATAPPTSTGGTGGPSRCGSSRRIAPWRRRNERSGSSPYSSDNCERILWYTWRASGPRPERYSASINWAWRRCRNGNRAASAVSSSTTAVCRPSRSSAS